MNNKNRLLLTLSYSELLKITQPPWVALLIGRVNQYHIKQMNKSLSTNFQKLNTHLIHWWPDKATPLAHLYQEQFVNCWNDYDSLSNLKDDVAVSTQQSLMGFYYLFKIYQPIELAMQQRRESLPNDINEVSINEIEKYFTNYYQLIEEAQQKQFNQWIESVIDKTENSWEEEVHFLFG